MPHDIMRIIIKFNYEKHFYSSPCVKQIVNDNIIIIDVDFGLATKI